MGGWDNTGGPAHEWTGRFTLELQRELSRVWERSSGKSHGAADVHMKHSAAGGSDTLYIYRDNVWESE